MTGHVTGSRDWGTGDVRPNRLRAAGGPAAVTDHLKRLGLEGVRVDRSILQSQADIAGIGKKLSNEQFVAKAPPEVIEEQHTRRAAAEAGIQKLGDALAQLKAAG